MDSAEKMESDDGIIHLHEDSDDVLSIHIHSDLEDTENESREKCSIENMLDITVKKEKIDDYMETSLTLPVPAKQMEASCVKAATTAKDEKISRKTVVSDKPTATQTSSATRWNKSNQVGKHNRKHYEQSNSYFRFKERKSERVDHLLQRLTQLSRRMNKVEEKNCKLQLLLERLTHSWNNQQEKLYHQSQALLQKNVQQQLLLNSQDNLKRQMLLNRADQIAKWNDQHHRESQLIAEQKGVENKQNEEFIYGISNRGAFVSQRNWSLDQHKYSQDLVKGDVRRFCPAQNRRREFVTLGDQNERGIMREFRSKCDDDEDFDQRNVIVKQRYCNSRDISFDSRNMQPRQPNRVYDQRVVRDGNLYESMHKQVVAPRVNPEEILEHHLNTKVCGRNKHHEVDVKRPIADMQRFLLAHENEEMNQSRVFMRERVLRERDEMVKRNGPHQVNREDCNFMTHKGDEMWDKGRQDRMVERQYPLIQDVDLQYVSVPSHDHGAGGRGDHLPFEARQPELCPYESRLEYPRYTLHGREKMIEQPHPQWVGTGHRRSTPTGHHQLDLSLNDELWPDRNACYPVQGDWRFHSQVPCPETQFFHRGPRLH